MHKKTVFHCILLFILVFSISKLIRLIFKKIVEKSNRAKTVFTLLDGLIKYGAAIALIFIVLIYTIFGITFNKNYVKHYFCHFCYYISQE